MTESGFVKAQSDNLPKIDVFMMTTFFKSNPNFTSVEIKGVKALRSERESYGDSAIGYVQVKREGDLCTVKARITPEHNVNQKCYAVTLTCDEAAETVLSIQCGDCTAHKGGCKHAIAFLAWLHRRSEDATSTSINCYWKKSKLSAVGTNLKFLKAKDLSKAPKIPQLQFNRITNGNFLAVVKKHSEELRDTDNQLMKYFKEPTKTEKLSMHYLVSTTPRQPENAQNFLQFCKSSMDIQACEDAKFATKEQSNSPLWHELRYARITASKVYEAAHCKTMHGSLTEAIMGALKFKDTEAMKRGKLLENAVIKEVEKIMKTKINSSGLHLNPSYPIIGASPDGENEIYTIEIKCPSSEKAMSYYLENNSDISVKCMAQVQMQMHLCNKQKALFCVALSDFEISKNVVIIEVEYNKEYCEYLIDKCTAFWCDAIFPLLFKDKN